jgi:hypothetical protein
MVKSTLLVTALRFLSAFLTTMMLRGKGRKIFERRSCLGDRTVDGLRNIKMGFREVNYEDVN